MGYPVSSLHSHEDRRYFSNKRMQAALFWQHSLGVAKVEGGGRSEHHVTRYVLLLLRYFNLLTGIWNLVPQYLTHSGLWPDLVLETFHLDPEKNRKALFISRVYIEIKVGDSQKNAIEQLLDSIRLPMSTILSSKGYLIGIEGLYWTIMEFQFAYPTNANTEEDIPEIILHNFYENPYNMYRGERPAPSKPYSGQDSMHVREDVEDMMNALKWISTHHESRDFVAHRIDLTRIPVSHTASTFPLLFFIYI